MPRVLLVPVSLTLVLQNPRPSAPRDLGQVCLKPQALSLGTTKEYMPTWAVRSGWPTPDSNRTPDGS